MRVFGSRWIRLSLISLNFLVFSAAAFANDYYVSPSGSDSNDGSQARPWKTIQHAASSFSVGTNGAIIHFANGTYSGQPDITRGGTSSSARAVWQCDAGVGSPYDAIGKCLSSDTWLVEANWTDIVGFDIGNNAGAGTAIVFVSNGGTTGSNGRAIGNYMHDMGSNVTNSSGVNGCPESGMILAQGGTSGTQVLGNLINTYGKGSSFAYSGPGCNTAQGIYIPNGVIYNNIVLNVPTSSVQLSNGCNSTVSNNVFIGGLDGIIIENNFSCLGHNTIHNNYFANHVHSIFTQGSARCTSSAPNLYGNNISDGSGNDFASGPYSCDTVTPSSPFQHQAPTAFFVNYQANGSGDYHPSSASMGNGTGTTSCVSGGLSPCVPTADIAGVSRVASLSIGAYESVQTANLPSAPTGLVATVQ